jgi:hypothetical protein
MAINNHEPEQISMEHGDEWYFDEFGEYRNTNPLALEDEDLQAGKASADEFGEIVSPSGSQISDNLLADDEFDQTLQSEHIGDQLDDPNLQSEAESDYHVSLGDKIKEKFDDLRGK